jgi:hypothetical protein
MTTTVAPARPAPQEIVHSATMKLETVTALLSAWIDKGGALDTSHLLAPLDVLREAEASLINLAWRT